MGIWVAQVKSCSASWEPVQISHLALNGPPPGSVTCGGLNKITDRVVLSLEGLDSPGHYTEAANASAPSHFGHFGADECSPATAANSNSVGPLLGTGSQVLC